MSQVVLFDGQWTMVRSLRPFANFERVYQDKPGTLTIAFPGDLDQYAARGVVGYDPHLLGAITVPLGARVTIWVPQTIAFDGEVPVVNPLYQYQVIWRLRSLKDFVTGQAEGQISQIQSYSSYHLATSGFGQPEIVTNPVVAANQRYYLPGALRTVAFEQTEPVNGMPSVLHLRGEYLQTVNDPIWTPPLAPDGAPAVWQQGAYVGSSNAPQGGPAYMTFTMDAEGDELAILASKIDTDPTWDFTTSSPGDLAFSNTFGNNNGHSPQNKTGILVTTGAG